MGSTTAVGVASPYLPPCTPTPPLPPPPPPPRGRSSSSANPSLFHLVHSPLAYALYARPRCGRRRLGQVRLSLGFNIGENTGFYLIARYVSLCPFSARGRNDGERILGTGGRTREGERERRRRLQVEEARRLSREREERKGGGREGIRERVHACVHASGSVPSMILLNTPWPRRERFHRWPMGGREKDRR